MVGASDKGERTYTSYQQPYEKKEFDYTHDPVFWLFIVPLIFVSLSIIYNIFTDGHR